MKTIIALCAVAVVVTRVMGLPAPVTSPCYDSRDIIDLHTTGCPNLYKKETSNIHFMDGHSQNIDVDGTGRCGTDGRCTDCEVSTTKECWPKFLTPCPGNEGGGSCWTGAWYQTVVSQTANTGNTTCPVSGCQITQTSCQDGTSFTFGVSHTCWECQ